MSDLNVLNPFAIMRSFLSGSNPPCQQLTMQTIDTNNVKSSETNYVTLTDITNIDPCTFPNKTNPVNGKKCKESFQDIHPALLPEDPLIQLYFAGLSVIGLFILYRLMKKTK